VPSSNLRHRILLCGTATASTNIYTLSLHDALPISQAHQVCMLDPGGDRVAEHSMPHTGAGLAALRTDLRQRVSDPARIAVAIEVPHGAVVDALLEHGCHVFAINPKQLDRFRDRHTVAGAKDDRRDA